MGSYVSCDSLAKFAFQEPRAPPVEIVPGYCGCVVGTLVPSGDPLISPVSGVPCVWARLIVWQWWRNLVTYDNGSTYDESGWKRCIDITRVVDTRLVAGGVAYRIAKEDALMFAADCAAAERGVSECRLAKEDWNGVHPTPRPWDAPPGTPPRAGATLPAAVRAAVEKFRSEHSGCRLVTENKDYRFTEIVVLPHSPVAALGTVVAEGIGGDELRLKPASNATLYNEELEEFVPEFPEARAALPPRAQRGWAALEAKLGLQSVFLACGRPSDTEGGMVFDEMKAKFVATSENFGFTVGSEEDLVNIDAYVSFLLLFFVPDYLNELLLFISYLYSF